MSEGDHDADYMARGAGAGTAQSRPRRAQSGGRRARRARTASSSGAALREQAVARTPRRVALSSAGEAARGATLYVTLEPCSHHGETPPCVDAIIASGVARVVTAMDDPDPRVAGRGHALLRAAGLEVATHVLEREARRDHLGHLLRVTQGRPMVTLKLARTPDGYAAGAAHDPRLHVTGPLADAYTHMQRALHDAIMVGAGTAREDDPLMTVRLPGMEDEKRLRVVLDTRLSLSPGSRFGATARAAPTLLIVGADVTRSGDRELCRRDRRRGRARADRFAGARRASRGAWRVGAARRHAGVLRRRTAPRGKPDHRRLRGRGHIAHGRATLGRRGAAGAEAGRESRARRPAILSLGRERAARRRRDDAAREDRLNVHRNRHRHGRGRLRRGAGRLAAAAHRLRL